MKQDELYSLDDEHDGSARIKRRQTFAHLYKTLPEYGSPAYWCVIEEDDSARVLPLEVLVSSLRIANARGDVEGRNRIMTRIIRRTQKANEYWASHVLHTLHIQAHERQEVVRDLFADLYEQIMRKLLDPDKTFWEENFTHCLRFERMHVLRMFLMREGWLKNQQGERVPRNLLRSLDATMDSSGNEYHDMTVEDELAQKALLAVELSDTPSLLLRLPDYLQSVLVLLFWEEKTEKEVATLLAITDRTVRNRLRLALHLLHDKLTQGRENIYG